SLPEVTSREPLADDPHLAVRLARGEGYLAEPRGWRETLTVEPATGRPDFHVIYPTNTRLPIVMAAVTGVFFLSMLLKVYWTIPLAVAGVAALAWRWVWLLGRREDLPPVPVGHVLRHACGCLRRGPAGRRRGHHPDARHAHRPCRTIGVDRHHRHGRHAQGCQRCRLRPHRR
ncbi:MAG: hypothetical protein ACLFPT_07765, partial [Ralstonia sp.]